MSCLPSWKRTQLQVKLLKKREQSVALDLIIDKAIESGNLNSIKWDSGEGKEESSYRSLDSLQKYQTQLEQQIESLENRLLCKGLINLGLKR